MTRKRKEETICQTQPPNPNLMDLAHELVEGSLDAKYDLGNTAAANTLLENAAQVYEEAGYPHDAEVCRLLIEEE